MKRKSIADELRRKGYQKPPGDDMQTILSGLSGTVTLNCGEGEMSDPHRMMQEFCLKLNDLLLDSARKAALEIELTESRAECERLKYRLSYIDENISDNVAIRFAIKASNEAIDQAIKEAEINDN